MALAGVHITFRYATTIRDTSATLPGKPLLSQYMTSAANPTGAKASIVSPGDNILLSISASFPIFYAMGANPDPTGVTGPNEYMDPANGREDVFASAGDKFAWMPA